MDGVSNAEAAAPADLAGPAVAVEDEEAEPLPPARRAQAPAHRPQAGQRMPKILPRLSPPPERSAAGHLEPGVGVPLGLPDELAVDEPETWPCLLDLGLAVDRDGPPRTAEGVAGSNRARWARSRAS